MNIKLPPTMIVLPVSAFFVTALVHLAFAAGPKVSEIGNRHNLSAIGRQVNSATYIDNTNTYQATNDPVNNPRGQQICIFCHTPHNANVVGQAPLWNRNFSSENFQRYSTSTLQIRKIVAAQYAAGAQPTGSSKLCLSCHDGVSKLGELFSGASITMTIDRITGFASFDANKMKTGHHPVSFVYNQSVADSINAFKGAGQYTMITTPPAPDVKLDKFSRMQCTTCHNAHQNMSDDADCYGGACGATSRKKAPFWAYHAGNNTASADRDFVCKACHALLPNSPLTPYP